MRNVRLLNTLILIIAFKSSLTVLANCTFPKNNKAPAQVQIIENGTCIDNQHQLNESATVGLILRCVGRQPTRWILDMSRDEEIGEGRSGWKIENERIGDVFVSDLVFNSGIGMFLGERLDERNISCLSSNITSLISRSNLLNVRTGSSCVSLSRYLSPDDAPDTPALVNMSIINNIGVKSCFWGDFLDNSLSNCPKQFTVDLTAKNAVCETDDRKQRIERFECRDLWACELLSLLKIDMDKCRGNFSNLNGTLGTESLPTLNNLTHMVLACSDTFKDVVWPSAVFLYRGFSESVSWTRFEHYESMEEALHNAIRLPGLSGEDFELSLNSTLYERRRTEFAENEMVELACIAIDSLIVKGVRWEIGYHGGQKETISTAENQTYHVDNLLNLMIVRRNFTFRRNISWISCEGPLWNSYKWGSDTLTVKVTNGIAPSVNLAEAVTNITTNDEILLTCVYGGWPRPSVTWNTEPGIHLRNETSHQPTDKIYEHTPTKVWFQTRVVSRSDSEFKVRCAVDNKVGTLKIDEIEIIPTVPVKTWIWILWIPIVIVIGTCSVCVPIIAITFRRF